MAISMNDFLTRQKIGEAMRSGRYFITVTTYDETTGQLNHWYGYKNFPKDDVLPTLEHFANSMQEEIVGNEENNS